jgi:hypothetical protein
MWLGNTRAWLICARGASFPIRRGNLANTFPCQPPYIRHILALTRLTFLTALHCSVSAGSGLRLDHGAKVILEVEGQGDHLAYTALSSCFYVNFLSDIKRSPHPVVCISVLRCAA